MKNQDFAFFAEINTLMFTLSLLLIVIMMLCDPGFVMPKKDNPSTKS